MLIATSTAVAMPGNARADQTSIHANGGIEVLGSGDAVSAGLRLHAGYGRSFGSGSVQPTVAIGATFGWGSLHVDDAGSPTGATSTALLEAGPELTLALRFADGGWADNHVFATAAWMYASVDEEQDGRTITGVDPGSGMRFGLGVSWVGTTARAIATSTAKSDGAFMWIVPQQLELVFERSGGFDRYGAVLAWGV